MAFNICTEDLVLQKASSDVQHKELEQRVIFELGMLRPGGMNVDFSTFIQSRFLPWRRYLATESSAKKPFEQRFCTFIFDTIHSLVELTCFSKKWIHVQIFFSMGNDIQLFSFTEFYKSSGFNNRRKSWQHLEYTGIDPGFLQWGRAWCRIFKRGLRSMT